MAGRLMLHGLPVHDAGENVEHEVEVIRNRHSVPARERYERSFAIAERVLNEGLNVQSVDVARTPRLLILQDSEWHFAPPGIHPASVLHDPTLIRPRFTTTASRNGSHVMRRLTARVTSASCRTAVST